MRTILMCLGLAVGGVSVAAELEPQWSDGIHAAAPFRYGGELAYRAIVTGDVLHFADARVDLPLAGTPDGRFLFAMQLGAGLTAVQWQDGSEGVLRARSIWGAMSWSFIGPRGVSAHGVGIQGGAPPRTTSAFWSLEAERAPSFVMLYDGYDSTRWVDVSTRVELGVAASAFPSPHVVVDAAAIFKPTAAFTVHAGLRIGTPRAWTAHVGVGVRPVPGLEVLATAVLPMGSVQGYRIEGVPVRPSIAIRLWDQLGRKRVDGGPVAPVAR